MGHKPILSRDLLAAAAIGYLPKGQLESSPPDWFDQALAIVAAPSRAGAPALEPRGEEGSMGRIDGYVVPDEVFYRLKGIRREIRPPASVWEALVVHAQDFESRRNLTEASASRMLYQYAAQFYQALSEDGDLRARAARDRLLIMQGNIELVIAGCLYREIGDVVVAELYARPEHRRSSSRPKISDLTGDWDRERQLRDLANSYTFVGIEYLRRLELDLGLEETVALFRQWSDQNDRWARRTLIDLERDVEASVRSKDPTRARVRPNPSYPYVAPLLAEGRIGEAVELLWKAPNEGAEEDPVRKAVRALSDGRRNAAMEMLRSAAAGSTRWDTALELLIAMLVEDGNEEELRKRADAGSDRASQALAKLLFRNNRTDELQQRADHGSLSASQELFEMMTVDGSTNDLAAEVDAGTAGANRYWLRALLDHPPIGLSDSDWKEAVHALHCRGLAIEYSAAQVNRDLIRLKSFVGPPLVGPTRYTT